jgi:hypothetical protein
MGRLVVAAAVVGLVIPISSSVDMPWRGKETER